MALGLRDQQHWQQLKPLKILKILLRKNNMSLEYLLILKKAFDTINHNFLINKRGRYGIRDIVLNWIISYLKNRQQFVKIGDGCSACLDTFCGFPQG